MSSRRLSSAWSEKFIEGVWQEGIAQARAQLLCLAALQGAHARILKDPSRRTGSELRRSANGGFQVEAALLDDQAAVLDVKQPGVLDDGVGTGHLATVAPSRKRARTSRGKTAGPVTGRNQSAAAHSAWYSSSARSMPAAATLLSSCPTLDAPGIATTPGRRMSPGQRDLGRRGGVRVRHLAQGRDQAGGPVEVLRQEQRAGRPEPVRGRLSRWYRPESSPGPAGCRRSRHGRSRRRTAAGPAPADRSTRL